MTVPIVSGKAKNVSVSMERWLEHSRNLTRVKDLKKRAVTIRFGYGEILPLISLLPKTRHDLQDMSKFIVDAYQRTAEGAVYVVISIHGEFVEVDNKALRSFDRSILLSPVIPGSKHAVLFCV
jgi:hypothetical protein